MNNSLYEYYKAQEMPRKLDFDKHLEQAFTYGLSAMKNGVCIDRKDFVDVARIPVKPTWVSGIDWARHPDRPAPTFGYSGLKSQQEKYYEMAQLLASWSSKPLPPEMQFAVNAINSAVNRALPSHNLSMIQADILGQAEKRFRPCQSCHQDFKYKSEDQWICQVCAGQRAETERRQEVEGDLLNANKVMK